MKLPTIWVDFNSVDSYGTTDTLLKFASDPASIYIGAKILAKDNEGASCMGMVLYLKESKRGEKEIVHLVLNMESFRND